MDDSEKDRPHVYSSLAQLAEHAAVNRRVVGSDCYLLLNQIVPEPI